MTDWSEEGHASLYNFLIDHEEDIHDGVNDFGELKDAFYDFMGREASAYNEA